MKIYDIRPIKERKKPVIINGRLVGYLEERPRIVDLSSSRNYKIVKR